ncbi:transposase [Streptomyces sp. NPDC004014]
MRGRLAAARGAWLVFEDEAGFPVSPPHAKTWSQRGRTPVIRVRGRSRKRISITALTCYKPGHRARLIYRPRHDDGRRDGRKRFSWRDYRELLIAAHQQLGGPIVLVRDNLNVHKAADLQTFAEARGWLTIYYPPPYAPDLNPVEGIWSLLRRGWLSDVAFSTPETPRPAHPARPTAHPVPQRIHRRLPRRDRPDDQTHLSKPTTSQVQPQCCRAAASASARVTGGRPIRRRKSPESVYISPLHIEEVITAREEYDDRTERTR